MILYKLKKTIQELFNKGGGVAKEIEQTHPQYSKFAKKFKKFTSTTAKYKGN